MGVKFMEEMQANVFSDVLFIVLLYKNDNFGIRAPYDIEILGKKMWEWVALAGSGAKIKTTEMAVFELLKTAKHPNFKEIQGYVK